MRDGTIFDMTGVLAGPFTNREAAQRHAYFLNGACEKQKRADRENECVRIEVHGPAYKMIMSDQRQEGEPRPHGVPLEYGRPSLVEIIAGAPSALPVSQRVDHGPAEARSEAFAEGSQDLDSARQHARDLGAMHRTYGLGPEAGMGPWSFRDRRKTGRRYRTAWNGEEPQEP
jgi:hypothetical protein